MSKKAMSSKIASAIEVGEKVLQEKEENSGKTEISAKKMMGIEVTETPITKLEEEWKQGQVIKFDKVSLKFTKEFFALFEVSFEAFEGEKIAIWGGNECGKTSVLRILAGLEKPFSGNVKLLNKKISAKLFASEVMLGFLPENPALLQRKTVLENMIFAKRIREKKTQTDADVASGVLFDLGLIDIKNKPVHLLTYCEKQCLAAARLKFRSIDILLIDNVFDNMTQDEVDKLMGILEKVMNPKTVMIYTTTDIVLAKKYAKRMFKIENGSMREQPIK